GFAWLMYHRQVPAEVGTIKRHPEKEPQCRDGGVDLRCAGAARRQMQLKAAYIFRFGCIGGSLEIARELLDPSHIVMLGLLRELPNRHFLDHAPTQRADSLLGHGAAPFLSKVVNPSSQDRTHPSATLLSRDRASAAAPYRASGLVPWPVCEISRTCKKRLIIGYCGLAFLTLSSSHFDPERPFARLASCADHSRNLSVWRAAGQKARMGENAALSRVTRCGRL